MKPTFVSITYAKLKELEEKAIIDPYSLKLSVKEQDLMTQIRTSLGLSNSESIPVLNEPKPVEPKTTRIRVWHETAAVVFNCSHMPLRTGGVPGVVWLGHPAGNPSGKALVEINLAHPELITMGITEECFKGKGKSMFYSTKDVRLLMNFKTDGPITRRFGGEGDYLRIGTSRRYPKTLVEQRVKEYWAARTVEPRDADKYINLVKTG